MSLTQLFHASAKPDLRLAHPSKSFGAKVSISDAEMRETMHQLKCLGARDESGNIKSLEFKQTVVTSSKGKVNFYFFAGEHACEWTNLLWCWGKHNREFELRISIVPSDDFKEDIRKIYLYHLTIEALGLFYPKIDGNRELHIRLKKPFDLKEVFERATISHTSIEHLIQTSPLYHAIRLLARLEDLASELDDELDDQLIALGLTNSLLKGSSKEIYKMPILDILRRNSRLCEAAEDFVMLGRDEVFIEDNTFDK